MALWWWATRAYELWNWHWARFGKAWGEKNKCVSVWLTMIFHQNSFHFLISWFPDFPSLDFISWFYFQLRFYFLILLIFNTAFCKFRFYFLISWFPIFQLSNFPDFQISSFFTFQDFQVSHFLISKCFVLFHISDIFNLVSLISSSTKIHTASLISLVFNCFFSFSHFLNFNILA